MTNLNYGLPFRLSRLGLSITLGAIWLIGLLLLLGGIPQPSPAYAALIADKGNSGLTATNDSHQPPIVVAVASEVAEAGSAPENLTLQRADVTMIVITPTALSHEFKGIGVHMFDADHQNPSITSTLDFTQVIDTLGLKYLRVPFGPDWNNADVENQGKIIPPPPACNHETHETDSQAMYEFIKLNFDGDFPDRLEKAKTISAIAQKRDLEIIFLNWQAHKNWRTADIYNELQAEYVDDYACFVAMIVKFLTDEGVKIDYLEPTNEPSITNTTKISPELYNTFVISLATYLKQENLSEIKIVGPGLAYLNHDNTVITWTMALNDAGVAALAGWAAHAWDPKFFTTTPEVNTLRTKWAEFHQAIKAKEKPQQPKPIFVTEIACVNDPSNGFCAVKNMLTLLDQGANAVIYWYLREQSWDQDPSNRQRALLTETYGIKLTFRALHSVFPFITGDAVSVLETQSTGPLTAASFVKAGKGTEEKRIMVALVNDHAEPETVALTLIDAVTGKHGIVLISNPASMTNTVGLVPCQADSRSSQCQFSLPPKTIATFVYPRVDLYLPVMMNKAGGSLVTNANKRTD